jgi:hypothetical protein
VLRAQRQRLQDQQVQRPLRQVQPLRDNFAHGFLPRFPFPTTSTGTISLFLSKCKGENARREPRGRTLPKRWPSTELFGRPGDGFWRRRLQRAWAENVRERQMARKS